MENKIIKNYVTTTKDRLSQRQFCQQRQVEAFNHSGDSPGNYPAGSGHHKVPTVFRRTSRPHRAELRLQSQRHLLSRPQTC